MSAIAKHTANGANATNLVAALVRAEGSSSHAYTGSFELLAGKHASRNLADAVHHICILHGRHPGVADHAANRTTHDDARSWLIDTVDGFIRERTFLTRLVVAAGPLPSTPAQSEAEAAVNGQRHAIDMLAQSDRAGCALGAALALVLDWHAIRGIVDVAAGRFGIEAPTIAMPSVQETVDLANKVATSLPVERAMSFGAQQLLAQHRGLWDLLEARQLARSDY
ncbi:MAG: hypothetical protein IPN84_07490 [Sphingomonadales bacterium]|jgi:hypothetical protein|nr:hypothetical protein [Sphingomonadales bacterium]